MNARLEQSDPCGTCTECLARAQLLTWLGFIDAHFAKVASALEPARNDLDRRRYYALLDEWYHAYPVNTQE